MSKPASSSSYSKPAGVTRVSRPARRRIRAIMRGVVAGRLTLAEGLRRAEAVR